MNDVSLNQFNALCPTCGMPLDDRTYIDIDGGMYFFRTIFECQIDNWALMTRQAEFNLIGEAVKVAGKFQMDRKTIMASPMAQIKLDLNYAVIQNFIADGLRNYPLSTVEKTTKNGDTFYTKTYTSTDAAFLHVFFSDLAARYGDDADVEKQHLALQAAVDYLKRMKGDELANARESKQDCEEALGIFDKLVKLSEKAGNKTAAKKVERAKLAWKNNDG